MTEYVVYIYDDNMAVSLIIRFADFEKCMSFVDDFKGLCYWEEKRVKNDLCAYCL